MAEKEKPTADSVRPEGQIPQDRGNVVFGGYPRDETLRIIHEQAKRGFETPGCDNWRAVEMCRQIMRLSEAEPATPMQDEKTVTVPLIPTDKMHQAGLHITEKKLAPSWTVLEVWKTMCAAAPKGRSQ